MPGDELILSHIQTPRDLRGLSYQELERLAAEIRKIIIETVSRNGGHLSSNLGVVELTIALHRVFDTPVDKIVWDVGHQCYAHKLLSGRAGEFAALRKSGGLAGFPRRAESPHDAFDTGHASTSISAALGLLAGERRRGGPGRAIAVIGDGALTGGLAYEALSHAGTLGLPLIVILNDNRMSISPNVGALSKHLSRLSMKAPYQSFRRSFDSAAKRLPLIGDGLYRMVLRLKRAVKAVFYTDNFFVDLGLEYVGPIEGHNIPLLEQVFNDVKKLERPVVVHVITQKGRGYGHAENNPSAFHGVSSFSLSSGLAATSGVANATFTDAFAQTLLEAARLDTRLVAITAAMDKGTGLAGFKAELSGRFFDTGIAEEHAVTFAAGLAVSGLRPVVALYSTFLQRAVDQVIHDVALQNLPVIFACDRAGFVPADGATHQGLFDISLFRAVPNMTILAPATAWELKAMFTWAVLHEGPVIIRYPKAIAGNGDASDSGVRHGDSDGVRHHGTQPIVAGRGVFPDGHEPGADTLLAFSGSLYPQAREAAALLAARGVKADLYNLRFLKPVDEDYITGLISAYKTVAVIEEGARFGGVGEYLAALAARKNSAAKIVVLAAADAFYPQGTREELLTWAGLDGPGIAGRVLPADIVGQ
jgi:1-deoxy-D-xylulose-5-phosphate synthase